MQASQIGVDPLKSAAVRKCLSHENANEIKETLSRLATQGFVPGPMLIGGERKFNAVAEVGRRDQRVIQAGLLSRSDRVALHYQIISKNKVSGLVKWGSLAPEVPTDLGTWELGLCGLMPATQSMRLAIAREVLLVDALDKAKKAASQS